MSSTTHWKPYRNHSNIPLTPLFIVLPNSSVYLPLMFFSEKHPLILFLRHKTFCNIQRFCFPTVVLIEYQLVWFLSEKYPDRLLYFHFKLSLDRQKMMWALQKRPIESDEEYAAMIYLATLRFGKELVNLLWCLLQFYVYMDADLIRTLGLFSWRNVFRECISWNIRVVCALRIYACYLSSRNLFEIIHQFQPWR